MDLSSILPLLMSKSGVGGDKMNTLMKFAHGEAGYRHRDEHGYGTKKASPARTCSRIRYSFGGNFRQTRQIFHNGAN